MHFVNHNPSDIAAGRAESKYLIIIVIDKVFIMLFFIIEHM